MTHINMDIKATAGDSSEGNNKNVMENLKKGYPFT